MYSQIDAFTRLQSGPARRLFNSDTKQIFLQPAVIVKEGSRMPLPQVASWQVEANVCCSKAPLC